MSYWQRLLKLRTRGYGESHLYTLKTLERTAHTLGILQQHGKSWKLYRKVYWLCKNTMEQHSYLAEQDKEVWGRWQTLWSNILIGQFDILQRIQNDHWYATKGGNTIQLVHYKRHWKRILPLVYEHVMQMAEPDLKKKYTILRAYARYLNSIGNFDEAIRVHEEYLQSNEPLHTLSLVNKLDSLIALSYYRTSKGQHIHSIEAARKHFVLSASIYGATSRELCFAQYNLFLSYKNAGMFKLAFTELFDVITNPVYRTKLNYSLIEVMETDYELYREYVEQLQELKTQMEAEAAQTTDTVELAELALRLQKVERELQVYDGFSWRPLEEVRPK